MADLQPTTPVEELREAARLMRERAQVAAPSPWSASPVWSPDSHATSAVYSHAHPTGSVASEVVASGRIKSGYGGIRNPRNAVHIASWHPQVAVAVADWLEDEAVRIDDVPYRVDSDWIERNYRAPLAVARAYLGGPRG